ncbi:hypothetical protein C8J57DRAFT_1576327 [Mycena rebaudengoi]|nr:hypothetical protein C8J57DRAFT_1576327 [Mycena rebaudengoi]
MWKASSRELESCKDRGEGKKGIKLRYEMQRNPPPASDVPVRATPRTERDLQGRVAQEGAEAYGDFLTAAGDRAGDDDPPADGRRRWCHQGMIRSTSPVSIPKDVCGGNTQRIHAVSTATPIPSLASFEPSTHGSVTAPALDITSARPPRIQKTRVTDTQRVRTLSSVATLSHPSIHPPSPPRATGEARSLSHVPSAKGQARGEAIDAPWWLREIGSRVRRNRGDGGVCRRAVPVVPCVTALPRCYRAAPLPSLHPIVIYRTGGSGGGDSTRDAGRTWWWWWWCPRAGAVEGEGKGKNGSVRTSAKQEGRKEGRWGGMHTRRGDEGMGEAEVDDAIDGVGEKRRGKRSEWMGGWRGEGEGKGRWAPRWEGGDEEDAEGVRERREGKEDLGRGEGRSSNAAQAAFDVDEGWRGEKGASGWMYRWAKARERGGTNNARPQTQSRKGGVGREKRGGKGEAVDGEEGSETRRDDACREAGADA